MFQTLCRTQFIGHIWPLAVFLPLSLVANANAQNYTPQVNVSIPITSSQIVYTPVVCTTSITQSCNGAWQILNLNGTNVMSTNGPGPGQGSIIPQMLFRSQAYAIYIYPSSLSNSTANITVSDGQASVFAQFNSSVGVVAILNLQGSATTTVSLTFVPSSSYSVLDIMSLILTVPANATATSLILPTATLPPSMTISIPAPSNTTTSTTTSTTSHASSNHTLIAYSVGISLGLGLGLTTFIVVGYICWRRRRLKNSDVSLQRGVGHAKGEVRS